MEPVISHASGTGVGMDARSLASRRASVMSTNSRTSQPPPPPRTRRRSLARFLASGLSAGPTLSKHD
jgi:hypothetical protein